MSSRAQRAFEAGWGYGYAPPLYMPPTFAMQPYYGGMPMPAGAYDYDPSMLRHANMERFAPLSHKEQRALREEQRRQDRLDREQQRKQDELDRKADAEAAKKADKEKEKKESEELNEKGNKVGICVALLTFAAALAREPNDISGALGSALAAGFTAKQFTKGNKTLGFLSLAATCLLTDADESLLAGPSALLNAFTGGGASPGIGGVLSGLTETVPGDVSSLVKSLTGNSVAMGLITMAGTAALAYAGSKILEMVKPGEGEMSKGATKNATADQEKQAQIEHATAPEQQRRQEQERENTASVAYAR